MNKKEKTNKKVELITVTIYHVIISYFSPEEKLIENGDLEVEHEAFDVHDDLLKFLREDVYESLCDLEKKTDDPLIKSRLDAKQSPLDIINEVNSHALNKSPHSRCGRSIIYEYYTEDVEMKPKKPKKPKQPKQ